MKKLITFLFILAHLHGFSQYAASIRLNPAQNSAVDHVLMNRNDATAFADRGIFNTMATLATKLQPFLAAGSTVDTILKTITGDSLIVRFNGGDSLIFEGGGGGGFFTSSTATGETLQNADGNPFQLFNADFLTIGALGDNVFFANQAENTVEMSSGSSARYVLLNDNGIKLSAFDSLYFMDPVPSIDIGSNTEYILGLNHTTNKWYSKPINNFILVGDTSSMLSPFAKKSLSNLSGVAINASLLPATTGAVDLGSSSKRWGSVWVGNGGLHTKDLTTHYMTLLAGDAYTADRILSVKLHDANRIIDLSGDLTVAGVASIIGTNTGDQSLSGLALIGLSNLSGVAVNTSLLPGVTSNIDIGSNSKRWLGIYLGEAGLHIKTSGTKNLIIGSGEGLSTTDRTLSILTNDVNRTLDMSGNLTIGDDATIFGVNTGDQDLSGYSLVGHTHVAADITDFNTAGDARWSLLAHTHAFSSLTSIPTTIGGYGITDFNSLGDARWQALDGDLTTIAGLTATTDNFIVSVASAWASRTPAQVKSTLSLNNVENTALSTWAGSTNVTTLGTIGAGTWQGTSVKTDFGGTGLTSYTQGDLLYYNSGTALSKLAKGSAHQYLSSDGASNNPSWEAVNLADGVSGNLPVGNLNSGTSASSSTFWRGDGTWAAATATLAKYHVSCTVDGVGDVVTTGVKGYTEIPATGTITAVTILGDVSGSVTFTIKKSNYSGFPGSLTSIVGANTPNLSSAQKNSITLDGAWTLSVTAGDIIEWGITGSPATITRAQIFVTIQP